MSLLLKGEISKLSELEIDGDKDWQGKGIASVLLEKLTEAARENGITSLVAHTFATNEGMIKLFNKLPYNVETSLKDGALVLTCNFERE